MENYRHPSNSADQSSVDVRPGFSMRALNCENSLEISELLSLYRRSYGLSHPVKRVYDRGFWTAQASGAVGHFRFLNLIAATESEFIGHLAVRVDKITLEAEVLSIALDPRFRRHIFLIGSMAGRLIAECARKQGWRHLLFYCPLAHRAACFLARRFFNCRELAILPGYIATKNGGRLDVLAMVAEFSGSEEARSVYLPARDAGRIQALYASLEMRRTFLAASPAENQRTTVSGDGIVVQWRRRYSVSHCIVTPSLIHNQLLLPLTLKQLEDDSDGRVYVHLLAEDARCPETAELMEDLGYRFCGLLPRQGRDFLLYASRHLSADRASSARTAPAAQARKRSQLYGID